VGEGIRDEDENANGKLSAMKKRKLALPERPTASGASGVRQKTRGQQKRRREAEKRQVQPSDPF